MKIMKIYLFAIPIIAMSSTTFASPISTSQLKSMDCATLAVEKANATRTLNAANQNSNATGKTVSKWAGIASNALSAFGGHSESATKAGNFANNLSNQTTTSDQIHPQTILDAQANIENISIYQKSKNCKF